MTKNKLRVFKRFTQLVVLVGCFTVQSYVLADGQMHQDSRGRWVNERGGNAYGDSMANQNANPMWNPQADPMQNSNADPMYNSNADPMYNSNSNTMYNNGGNK